jgi:hypothetical protein
VGPLTDERCSLEGQRATIKPVRDGTLSGPRDLSCDDKLGLAGNDSKAFFPEDADGGSGLAGLIWLRRRRVAAAPRSPFPVAHYGRKPVRRPRYVPDALSLGLGFGRLLDHLCFQQELQ